MAGRGAATRRSGRPPAADMPPDQPTHGGPQSPQGAGSAVRGSSLEAEVALGSLGFEPAASASSRSSRRQASGSTREADLIRQGLGYAPERVALPVETALTPVARCCRGHTLEGFTTPHDGFECDMCGQRAPANSQLWGCRTCDHDICRGCREKVLAAARTEALRCGDPLRDLPEPADVPSLPGPEAATSETASSASCDTRGRLPVAVFAAAAARAGERAQRASSQGRSLATKVGGAARRATSPLHAAFFGRGGDARRDGGGAGSGGGGDASPDAGSDDETPARAEPQGDGLTNQAQGELVQLRRDLAHQIAQRKQAERTLSSEKSRCEFLEARNKELLRASEEKLRGQERCQNAETAEMEDQLQALQEVKRQLFQRIQSLEGERSTLTRERDEATTDRSCVVCMDRLANTVFYRCLHLVCCDGCAKKVQACPVCRHQVRDRLTVFMM